MKLLSDNQSQALLVGGAQVNKDILDTINKGVNIASKVVSKGVGDIQKTLKPTQETARIILQTGLYFRRNAAAQFGRFIPDSDFFEPQIKGKIDVGLIKNITLPAAERLFIQACNYLLLGKEKDAFDKFQETVTKDPQLTDGYYMLGCLGLARGEYKSSLENFKKANLLQQSLGKTIKKYLPSFKMTLNVTHNSCFAFFADLVGINTLLPLAMRAEGLPNDAFEVLAQMLGVMPSQPVLLFYISALLFEIGSYDRIVEYLKTTVPDGNLGYLNMLILGRALISLGDLETAREVFKKGIGKEDIDPEILLDYRFSLGLCDATSGWSSGRNEEMERVYQAKPDYQDIFERLGLGRGSQIETASRAPSAPPQVSQEKPVKPPVDRGAAKEPQIPQKQTAPPPREAPLSQVSSQNPRLLADEGKVDLMLEKQAYIIGREIGDVIMSWDASASKQHARILKENNRWYVEDLGSTNGTWVNQFRISKRVDLNRGDQIKIGNTIFRFL